MKLTKAWLKDHDTCEDAIEMFSQQEETDSNKILKLLTKRKQYAWANWLIVRLLRREDAILYAIYAAEQVLPIFEDAYPGDLHPRQAIEAAKKGNASNALDAARSAAAKSSARAATEASDSASAFDAAYKIVVAAYAATEDADKAATPIFDAARAASKAANHAATEAAARAAIFDAAEASVIAIEAVAKEDGKIAAEATAEATSYAFDAARKANRSKMMKKIIRFGIVLLKMESLE